MIENAWRAVSAKTELRRRLALGDPDDNEVDELMEDLEDVIPSLRDALEKLEKEDLLQFDRILERKLYEIDRADVHEQTDGSDDGFLYARGFVVAMGRGYYDAVNENPAMALMDTECEEICYLPCRVYEAKFGEMPESAISRESGSNKLGWPEDRRCE